MEISGLSSYFLLKNAAAKSRSEQRAAGYREALRLVHESGDQIPFPEGTVLQLRCMR